MILAAAVLAAGPVFPPGVPHDCPHYSTQMVAGREVVVDAYCGQPLTPVEVVRDLRAAGCPWGEKMTNAVLAVEGESVWDGRAWAGAWHANYDQKTGQLRSLDKGATQVNNVVWPWTSRHFNLWTPQGAFGAMRVISHGWTDFNDWRGWRVTSKADGMRATAQAWIDQAQRAGVR